MEKDKMLEEKIGLGTKIGMLLGGMGGVPLFALISAFLTYFYTNVVGLNPGAVGMIILISKVFDGVSDLILGNVIDKTRTKKGVCRPWVLRMALFSIVGVIGLFTVPDIENMGKLIYVFISYNVSQTIIYTIMLLALTSLPTYMTRDSVQRSGLFVWSSIGQSVMTVIVSGVTLNLVTAIGGGQKAWILVSVIYAIIGGICLFATGTLCKENINPDEIVQEGAKVPFFTVLKSILQNKYWFEILGIVIVGVGVYVASLQMHTYYAQYILGNVELAGSMNMAYTLPLIFMGFILLPLVKHFSKKAIMLGGVLIQFTGCVLIVIAPSSLSVILAATAMKSIGQSCAATMYLPMLGDSIEYGQWKTGVRSQAALMGANGAGQKIGQGVVTAVLGGIMAAAGFDGTALEQSTQAVGSISNLFLFIPLILTVLELIIIFIYDLDKRYPQIMKELMEREKNDNTDYKK